MIEDSPVVAAAVTSVRTWQCTTDLSVTKLASAPGSRSQYYGFQYTVLNLLRYLTGGNFDVFVTAFSAHVEALKADEKAKKSMLVSSFVRYFIMDV